MLRKRLNVLLTAGSCTAPKTRAMMRCVDTSMWTILVLNFCGLKQPRILFEQHQRQVHGCGSKLLFGWQRPCCSLFSRLTLHVHKGTALTITTEQYLFRKNPIHWTMSLWYSTFKRIAANKHYKVTTHWNDPSNNATLLDVTRSSSKIFGIPWEPQTSLFIQIAWGLHSTPPPRGSGGSGRKRSHTRSSFLHGLVWAALK